MAYDSNPFQITAFQKGAFQFGVFQQEADTLPGGFSSQDDYREAIRRYDEKEAKERLEKDLLELERHRLLKKRKKEALERIKAQAAETQAQQLAALLVEHQNMRKRIQDEEEAFIFINSSIF